MGVSGVGSGSKRRGGEGGWQRFGTRLASAKIFQVDDHGVSAPKTDLWGPSGPPEHRQEVHPAHAGQGKRGSPGIVGRLEALNHRPDAPRTPKEANISDPPTGQLRTGPPMRGHAATQASGTWRLPLETGTEVFGPGL